jgi:hypothetical protein
VKTKVIEPRVDPDNYVSTLSHAFNWYHQEKEKKDARAYLKEYITLHFTKKDVKTFDRLTDSQIVNTYAWISRMLLNGAVTLKENEQVKFTNYLQSILDTSDQLDEETEEVEEVKTTRPSVRENMEEKVREYLGELEGVIDDIVKDGGEFDLFKNMQGRALPVQYVPYIQAFVKSKAGEFIYVYENFGDEQIKEGYSNLGKRKVTLLIKTLSHWLEDLERYGQFKKANRKPRPKKIKPPTVQVAKLKYLKESEELKIKSVNPTELVGASQVWIYNVKYKKLAVYRSDSSTGLQVKGTTVQNYDPDQCEQKTLRKPADTLKKVLEGGKVQLRKLLSELTTKESNVNGRINEDCLIVRVFR